LLDLKHFTGDLLNALGNRPAVLGFERDRPQKVECSLDQIVWLRHTMVIYNKNCRLSRVAIRQWSLLRYLGDQRDWTGSRDLLRDRQEFVAT